MKCGELLSARYSAFLTEIGVFLSKPMGVIDMGDMIYVKVFLLKVDRLTYLYITGRACIIVHPFIAESKYFISNFLL